MRWGERTVPLAQSEVQLPPCERTALEMVRAYMALKHGSRVKSA